VETVETVELMLRLLTVSSSPLVIGGGWAPAELTGVKDIHVMRARQGVKLNCGFAGRAPPLMTHSHPGLVHSKCGQFSRTSHKLCLFF
jgi:hypothetical protein